MKREFCDMGALGPDWRWAAEWQSLWASPRERAQQLETARTSSYYTTCPASLRAYPVVNGIARLGAPA